MSLVVRSRRTFLKAAGVCIALPALESLPRVLLAGDSRARKNGTIAKSPPRRMVCVGNEFGMYPGAFWPSKTGRDYELTTLLEPLGAAPPRLHAVLASRSRAEGRPLRHPRAS